MHIYCMIKGSKRASLDEIKCERPTLRVIDYILEGQSYEDK